MKKIFLLLIVMILISGCGVKTKNNDKLQEITCSLKEEDNGFTSVSKIDVNFKNDVIVKYTTSTDINVPDEYTNIMDTLLDNAKTPFLEYENLSGVTIKSKKGDNTLYVSLSVNSSKVKDEDKEKVNEILDLNSNYDTIKNSFEALNYECK